MIDAITAQVTCTTAYMEDKTKNSMMKKAKKEKHWELKVIYNESNESISTLGNVPPRRFAKLHTIPKWVDGPELCAYKEC